MIHSLSFFSNRELALLIWLIIVLVYSLIKDKWRCYLKRIITSAFALKLVIVYITLIIYAFVIILLLYLTNIWEICLLKDTIIWLLFSALATAFTLINIKNFSYFTGLIKSNITVTAIVQFIINLYSFSLAIELIMLPIIVFTTALSAYSEYYTKNGQDYHKVHSCLNILLSIIGIVYLGFTFYKAIIGFDSINWIDISQQLMLPIILTILFIPYYWLLALYINYEKIFVAINVMFRHKNKYERYRIKFYILYYGCLSLKRINRINNEISFLAYQNTTNYKSFFKEAMRVPLYINYSNISKMKIELFNNIDDCRKAFSKLQLGELSEWKKIEGSNEFYCITNYLSIKKDWLSNLVLSLQGEELYIHQLELSLSILSPNERDYAILKFQECVFNILRLLSLKVPHNIITQNNYAYNNEIFSLNIKNEIIGTMESFLLVIKSE